MRKMAEVNLVRMLREGDLRVPLLDIRLIEMEPRGGADAVLEVSWRGQSRRYVAELKRDAKPQTLKLAIEQAKRFAAKSGQGDPMVIAPYLSEEKLEQLLAAGVSGLDLCGNAAVEAPKQFLFWRTGNRNRYPDSAPIRSAYRGDSSLVARMLLLRPVFQKVGDIVDAIQERGGSLTMGTVSKVLQRLGSDLVIERFDGKAVRLIQPARLLDQLLDAYQPPKVEETWLGKVALDDAELMRRLEEVARDSGLIRSGDASASEYAVYAGEPVIACYCRETPAKVLKLLGADFRETLSFPNLRLMQTGDQRVYFDPRPRLAASPIQAWLEMAGGDKRQKESAVQIRRLLLNSIGTVA